MLSNGEKVPPMDMELALSLLPVVEQALVIGEGESFLSAILVLNPEEWPAFAKSCGLDADAQGSLDDEKMKAKLVKMIRPTLKDFPVYAKVRRVIVTLEPWTIDNSLLTPTLKIKRARVLEKYADEINALYANGH